MFFVKRPGNFVLLNTLLSVCLTGYITPVAAEERELDDYLALSLENLMNTTVSSVTKKKQTLKNTAAAVYVISDEQIRRSGYQTVPDLLRMVPGLQVAKIDGNNWAVSARGFNGQVANKLLVLQDGRTLYNPVYSGVYWDAQDLILDDIERIEIIRGPGASVWGVNAVNGVINIISKDSSQTQGTYVKAGAGSGDKNKVMALRHGFEWNARTTGRTYLKYSESDSHNLAESGADANDDGKKFHGGFRLDGEVDAKNSWTLQGDYYDIKENQIYTGLLPPLYRVTGNQNDEINGSGWNLLGRGQHSYTDRYGYEALISFQVFYDHNQRDELVLGLEYDTFDVEFMNRQRIFTSHELTWGLGYRHIRDEYHNSFYVSLNPDSLDYSIANAFVQDQIELNTDMHLTVGAKLESHELYATELQPSIRFHWSLDTDSSFWAAVSRAVRTPSRFERGGTVTAAMIPVPQKPPAPPLWRPLTIGGDDSFNNETLIAYEAGYRIALSDRFSVDLALFYNDFDQLQTLESTGMNSTFQNRLEGTAYGLELSNIWRAKEWWQLSFTYSYITLSMNTKENSTDTLSGPVLEGSAPQSEFYISSWMDLKNQWALDLSVHYVGALDKTRINSQDSAVNRYINTNVRLTRKLANNISVSLIGNDLLGAGHLEYYGQSQVPAVENGRSVFLQIEATF
ncbi:MAG: TonB-dependent receptor plug domain-containing protein [Pontibacterium sp.]